MSLASKIIIALNEDMHSTLQNHGWTPDFKQGTYRHKSYPGHSMEVGHFGNILHTTGQKKETWVKHHELSDYLREFHKKLKV